MTTEVDRSSDSDNNPQVELDKELAFANLDQTIGDREQAIEDFEQEHLDDTQAAINQDTGKAVDDGAGRPQRAH